MTYLPGDPGHIDVHTQLRATLEAMGATTLPSAPELGDAGHVEDHAAIRTALLEVATSWGLELPAELLPPEPVLGDPDHVADHNMADDAIAWLDANGFNEAVGGTVTTVADYNGTGETWRVHTFTTTDTLTVRKAPQLFRVLAVAGGGSGTGWSSWGWEPPGGGGGGGEVLDVTDPLAVGDIPVTIGGANTDTTVGTFVVARGGKTAYTRGGECGDEVHSGGASNENEGGGGGGAGANGTAYGGDGLQADVTGTLTYYGGGGGGGGKSGTTGYYGGGQGGGGTGVNDYTGQAGQPNTGGGGGGGGKMGGSPTGGGQGGTGIAAIAYRIG